MVLTMCLGMLMMRKFMDQLPRLHQFLLGVNESFLLKKKPSKTPSEQSTSKQPKGKRDDQHSFVLRYGWLLVMRGYIQRNWFHSVPKRAKADAGRINLTFRHIPVSL